MADGADMTGYLWYETTKWASVVIIDVCDFNDQF